MEKLTPSCPLSVVRKLIEEGKVRSTFSALAGAAALGLDYSEMLGIILTLTPKDFYKSMTTHKDHRVWQDVYKPVTEAGAIYLKLTVVDDLLIVSFKEL
jgi:motility quorum-sensing regulator / GCU-specific mRNA interferase toxin